VRSREIVCFGVSGVNEAAFFASRASQLYHRHLSSSDYHNRSTQRSQCLRTLFLVPSVCIEANSRVRPGDRQHLAGGIANPFGESLPRVSTYTALEIATLQSRLDKQLGPEYISSRSGPGGNKVHYLAAEKVINLANEVFGFNGWSSAIRDTTIDYVSMMAYRGTCGLIKMQCDMDQSGKYSIGVSIIVRVTLKDGTYHEVCLRTFFLPFNDAEERRMLAMEK
jgi:hypothetical protein